VRITADTNVLLRAAVGDDPGQARLAAAALRDAEVIAVTLPALCEFVWVLRRGYKLDTAAIITALRRLLDAAAVTADRPAAEAGIAALAAGGDFADGCIAFDGRRLGGFVFTSFDQQAVTLVKAGGGEARLLESRKKGRRL
jgi:predicted nucleic-acid-binding protein